MLGKLIKYEFRATARYYLPIFAIMVILGLVLLPIVRHANGMGGPLQSLLTTLYVLAAIVLAVMTLVVTIRRFYTHLLKDEGYLMFTLPVTAGQNILGKLIPATCWSLIGLVLGILCTAPGAVGGIGDIPGLLGPTVILLIVAVILSIAAGILFFYLCMAIGQLFNTHKFLAAVVVFLVLTVVFNILGILFLARLFAGSVLAGIFSDGMVGWVSANPAAAATLAGVVLVVICLVICLILFFLTRWLLNRKLNLT